VGDIKEVCNWDYDRILRFMPLSDGYLLQAEAWLRRGLRLKDNGAGGKVSVWKHFRSKYAARS
jgi:hypothetical protein